jgi:hypothetical protein
VLLCTPAELVEVELIDGEVEMELAAGLGCMELVLEVEGMDGGLGELCVDALDVEVLDVFDVCWANTKAGPKRMLATTLDRRTGIPPHTLARTINSPACS